MITGCEMLNISKALDARMEAWGDVLDRNPGSITTKSINGERFEYAVEELRQRSDDTTNDVIDALDIVSQTLKLSLANNLK
ncbi:hypothetical protein BH23PAT1_BH23PAT1_3380 [soil metagenome]